MPDIGDYAYTMGLEYSIAHEQSFIKVSVSGTPDYLSIHRVWSAVAQACDTHDCRNVLGESDLDLPISITDAYEHDSLFQALGITPDYRIAWAEKNSEAKEVARFIETVLLNRGRVKGHVFDNISEARLWLEAGANE